MSSDLSIRATSGVHAVVPTSAPAPQPLNASAQASLLHYAEVGQSPHKAEEAAQASAQPRQLAMEEAVRTAIEQLIQKVASNAYTLDFSVDSEKNGLLIKVINDHTDETIREIHLENLFGFSGGDHSLRGVFVMKKV